MWKNDAVIDAEVLKLRALRKTTRQFTAFNDDNHAAIDAQCSVLRERMSYDDLYDAYGNEDADDFAQHTLDAALMARDWMTGALASDEGSPSDYWSTASEA